jgi:hypothetical protein
MEGHVGSHSAALALSVSHPLLASTAKAAFEDLDEHTAVALGSKACGRPDELGDLARLDAGLRRPRLVGAAFGAAIAVELVEEQQASRVE